jgi:hypothetical protein
VSDLEFVGHARPDRHISDPLAISTPDGTSSGEGPERRAVPSLKSHLLYLFGFTTDGSLAAPVRRVGVEAIDGGPSKSIGVVSEHRGERIVDAFDATGFGLDEDGVRTEFEDGSKPVVEAPALAVDASHLEFVDDDVGQIGECLFRLVQKMEAGFEIDDTDVADVMLIWCHEGCAGVESNAGGIGHEGVALESFVSTSVGDDHDLVVEDRVGTERLSSRRLSNVQTAAGFEPLSMPIDEGHGCDRDFEDADGHVGNAIEGFFGGRVEDVIGREILEASFFVVGTGGSAHRKWCDVETVRVCE